MRKLFLSYTATQRDIAAGKITDNDLSQGFFLFGCVREHAFQVNDAGQPVVSKEGADAHSRLAAALKCAEAEGRAGWVRPTARQRRNDWEVLNGMLAHYGYAALPVLPGFERFSHAGLEASLRRLGGHALQPVY